MQKAFVCNTTKTYRHMGAREWALIRTSMRLWRYWTGCKNTKIRFVVQSKFNDFLQLPDEACIIIMALLAFLAYIWLSTLCLSEFPIGLFT